MDRRTFLSLALAAPAFGKAAKAVIQGAREIAWTQWGGPTRNFQTEATGLRDTWPAAGPRVVWKRPLGEGYSSVLMDGSALVTIYRRDDDELVVALYAETGARRWVHSYRAPLLHNGNFDVSVNSAGPAYSA